MNKRSCDNPFVLVRNQLGAGIVLLTSVLWLTGCAADSKAPEQSSSKTPPTDFDTGAGKKPSAKTLNSLARILATQGKDDECVRVLRGLLYQYPDYLPAYSDLAEAYLRLDKTDNAIEVLSAGLKQSPADPVLNNNLGMCYFLEEEYQSSLECFDKAIEASPQNSSYLANRAAALALLGDETQAKEAYGKILSPVDTQANLEILARAREKSDTVEGEPLEVEQPVPDEAAAPATP